MIFFISRHFLSIIFLLLFSTSSTYCTLPTHVENKANKTEVSAENKQLQNKVLVLIDTLLRIFNKIGARITKLKLPQEKIAEVSKELASMQSNLNTIRAKQSLHVQKDQLVRLLKLINALSKSLEKSLKKSFAVLPTIDPQNLKRSIREMTPEALEKMLKENENRLKSFDKLINNMNKSFINRTYTALSDWWHTPVISLQSLGSSNKDIYISSILKRMFVYSSAVGLVVRNTPQDVINQIPNYYINKWVSKLKVTVGSSPFSRSISNKKKAHHTKQVNNTGHWVLGDPHTYDPDALTRLMPEDGNYIQAVKVVGENLQTVPVIMQGTSLVFGEKLEENIQYYLLTQAGERIPFNKADNILSRISYIDNFLVTSSGAYYKQYAPNKWCTIDGHPLELNTTTGTILPALKPENSDYSFNGDSVKNIQVYGKTPQFATESSQTKNDTCVEDTGILSKVFGNTNWIAPVNLSQISFEIGAAAWVAQQVYNDLAVLKKDIPAIASYVHSRLRGEIGEVSKDNFSYIPSDITFDDVVGREEIKTQLQPLINFVKNPENYIQAGIKIPRGYMLAGEPQTGKTQMVKALAGELSKAAAEQGKRQCKLFPVDVQYIIKNGLRPYIEEIKYRNLAPCILFCDEFDLTGAQRTENKEFLADALTSLSGYTTSSDLQELIIFVIATNRPENIDYAITADGRCGTTLYFEKPYYEDRKNYFASFFKKKVLDLQSFDLDTLAQETEACSYGTLETIAHEISRIAEGRNEIPCQRHAEQALNNIVRKIIVSSNDFPEEKRHIMATRYAAKSFASVYLQPDKKFVGATIMKITEAIKEQPVLAHYDAVANKEKTGIRFGNIFTYNNADTYGLVSNNERIKECKIALAGTVGQKVLGLDQVIYTEDETEALIIARRILFNGCDEKLFPHKVREQKGIQAYLLVEKCRQEVQELLESYKEEFMKLTELLQKRKVIRTSDVKQCFGLDELDLIEDYFSPSQKDENNSTLLETPLKEELLRYSQEDALLDELEAEEEETQTKEKEIIEQHYQDKQKNARALKAAEEERNRKA